MSVFTPDFTKVEASIPVYEKGRYRVQITKATPFVGETKDDATGITTVNSGIRYGLEMFALFGPNGELITEDYKGRVVTPYKIWLHTQGGWQFGKPFIMAACGYKIKDEQLANEKLFQGQDWSFKGDLGMVAEQITVGTMWNTLLGKMVDVNMSIKVSANKVPGGDEYKNQEFGSWAPVAG